MASNSERAGFFVGRWLCLRTLGIVQLVAVVSLWTQVHGLVGSRGILPAAGHLEAAREQLGAWAWWRLPTLGWLSASDGMLHALCALGTAFALLLILDLAPPLALGGFWLVYLSLMGMGQDFLSFQWDSLLLETTLAALFLCPWRLRPRLFADRPAPRAGLWLFRALLFKLMFLSGAVKLLSGDATWWGFTALPLHYETQPLPHALSWFVFHAPGWFHQASLWAMFAIELAAPFLLFLPRLGRQLGGALQIALQVVILFTGNFTFFNHLTIALCLPLFDDRFWGRGARWLPAKLRERFEASLSSPPALPGQTRIARAGAGLRLALAAFVLLSSALVFVRELSRTLQGAERRGQAEDRVLAYVAKALAPAQRCLLSWGEPWVLRPIAPFSSINGYGLFRVMTTERPEIIVEASANGSLWQEIAFRYKPGDLQRRPALAAPHQPRLDWQMWFAALHPQGYGHLLQGLARGILEGSPAVRGLLEPSPLLDPPPRFVRFQLYRYHFTTLEERRASGAWWKREHVSALTRPIELKDLR